MKPVVKVGAARTSVKRPRRVVRCWPYRTASAGTVIPPMTSRPAAGPRSPAGRLSRRTLRKLRKRSLHACGGCSMWTRRLVDGWRSGAPEAGAEEYRHRHAIRRSRLRGLSLGSMAAAAHSLASGRSGAIRSRPSRDTALATASLQPRPSSGSSFGEQRPPEAANEERGIIDVRAALYLIAKNAEPAWWQVTLRYDQVATEQLTRAGSRHIRVDPCHYSRPVVSLSFVDRDSSVELPADAADA